MRLIAYGLYGFLVGLLVAFLVRSVVARRVVAHVSRSRAEREEMIRQRVIGSFERFRSECEVPLDVLMLQRVEALSAGLPPLSSGDLLQKDLLNAREWVAVYEERLRMEPWRGDLIDMLSEAREREAYFLRQLPKRQ